MRAAVLESLGRDHLAVRDDVRTLPVAGGQVRVRLRAAGVCGSDLSVMAGHIEQPLPVVLGHEGAGEVVEVGPGVSGVSEGDHVVLAWVAPCGWCAACERGQPYLCLTYVKEARRAPAFRRAERPLYGMLGCGTWADEVVVPAAAVVPVARDVPFEVAALVGCAVTTGVGAVLNTAAVPAGATAVVIGCGGVGLNVVQALRLAGAGAVLAVDPVAGKRDLALGYGATRATDPDGLAESAAEMGLRKGFDFTFDVVGQPATIKAAWQVTRRGGSVILVGAGPTDQPVPLTPSQLLFDGRRIVPALYGSADIHRDFPRFLDHWRDGELDITGMISRRLPLDEVGTAVDDLEAGTAARQVIIFDA